MKKLIALVFITIFLIIVLIVLAFLYIDLTGHKSFKYGLLLENRLLGTVEIDRYSTEDKIIYKSNAKYPYSLGYPAVSEKLSLKKRTMKPVSFKREANGVKGRKSLSMLVCAGGKADFLFLEHPRFITLEGIIIEEGSIVFSPEDIMLYLPVMEKYNYWQKGVQFFNVLIPVDETVPPLEETVEVRYLKDEYVPVMGHRAIAEEFVLLSKTLPEIKIFTSKYTHRILAVEIDARKIRFVLTNFTESPGERISPLLDKFVSVVKPRQIVEEILEGDELPLEEKVLREEEKLYATEEKKPETANRVRKKDIFFESANLVLSGSLSLPEAEGAHPALVIVPDDGPMPQGEKRLIDSITEFLSEKGFVTLVFDGPGQGKSQGTFAGVDDAQRVQNLISAVSYLKKQPEVQIDSINLIGYEGGGYIALKAALANPEVRSCILLGLPQGFIEGDSFKWASAGTIRTLVNYLGLGTIDEKIAEKMASKLRKHLESVTRSTESFSFFQGIKIPLKEYRQFIARKVYEDALSFTRPMLIAIGRDDKYFDLKTVDGFKEAFARKNDRGRVAVFRNLGSYMGNMTPDGEVWGFSANADVLGLIGNWIQDNGIAKQQAPPPVEEGSLAPVALPEAS